MHLQTNFIAVIAATILPGVAVAANVSLVADGRPDCQIIIGANATDVERNACKTFQTRMENRTNCRLPLTSEQDMPRSVGHNRAAIVIGAVSHNALSRGLWQQSGRPAPGVDTVGPGGFAIGTLDYDGKTWILLSGADDRGTVCAVGKFLREIDFSPQAASVARLEIVDKIVPADVMESQQYKPSQWGNAFKDAPIERMRRYVEDMAFWGSSSYWNVCCYMTNDPFSRNADDYAKANWRRVKDLYVHARSLGMEIGYVDCPNSVYDDQLWLRKLGGKFRYPQDVCPSNAEVRRILLQNRENIYRDARLAGIRLKYCLHFAHDNGGCDCQQCRPWIRTYLKLSEEMNRIAAKYHPGIKTYLTTWMCSPEEQKLMLDYVRNEKPAWVAGVMARPGVPLPSGYVSSGWQTIFGCDNREVFGKMGADPLPLFIFGKIREYHDRGIRAIFTYSEGIYDDISSAIAAQACRRPSRGDVRELLSEYCRFNFGTDRADSESLAQLILDRFKSVKIGAFNASLRVEKPAETMATMEKIETRMPAWGKTDWRYGILKTRVYLERLDQDADGFANWLREADAILTKAAAKNDDAALTAALADVKKLAESTADHFSRLVKASREATVRLYSEYYGTPNRASAHGVFSPRLPSPTIPALLAKRCDELAAISNANNRKEAVAMLLISLKSQYASSLVGGKPTFRQGAALTIPGSFLRGGAIWKTHSEKSLLPGAKVIDAAKAGPSTVSMEFNFESGEEPLKGPARLVVYGASHASGDTPIEITINGRTVFRGKNGFELNRISSRFFSIPAELIMLAENRLEIKNLSSGQGNEQIRICGIILQE